jgi:hypothetical protein
MKTKSIFSTNVSFLSNVAHLTARPCRLADLLLEPTFKDKVLAIRAEKDPARQKEMKKQLPCFTASGLFGNPVNAKNLQEHSGFICIDLDAHDNEGVEDFTSLKDRIHEIPYVQYCGLSVRGNGFFCLIPIKDPSKHRRYFKALQRDFKNCGLTIDPACSDVCRKRFVSYDPEPYINTASEVYDFTIPEYDSIQKRVADMTDVDVRRNVEALFGELDKRKTDITGTRQTWFEVLCALASQFGEDGRDYAHRVSQHYPGYAHEETDALYSDVLRHNGYSYTIGTLFYHANKVLDSAEYAFKDVLVYDDDDL